MKSENKYTSWRFKFRQKVLLDTFQSHSRKLLGTFLNRSTFNMTLEVKILLTDLIKIALGPSATTSWNLEASREPPREPTVSAAPEHASVRSGHTDRNALSSPSTSLTDTT